MHRFNITVFFALMIVLFSLMCGISFADNVDRTGAFSFNETTGLINMPTARTADYKTMMISIRLAKVGMNPPIKHKWQDSGQAGIFTGTPLDSDWWMYCDGDRRLLASPIRNFEINLMNIRSQHLTPIIAAKVVALEESKYIPAFAIGIHNAFRADDDLARGELKTINSRPAPFAVVSKSFGSSKFLDLSAGYGGGRFRKRIFYGGEAFFDKKHYISAVGEYDGNIYSYGLKYRLPGGRWNFGAFMQDKTKLGLSFSYVIPW